MLFRRCIGFVLGAGSTNTNPKSQLNNHRLLDLYSLRHLVKNPPVVFCVWTFYLKHWFYLYNRTNFAFDVFFCSVFNLLFFYRVFDEFVYGVCLIEINFCQYTMRFVNRLLPSAKIECVVGCSVGCYCDCMTIVLAAIHVDVA